MEHFVENTYFESSSIKLHNWLLFKTIYKSVKDHFKDDQLK